MTNDLMIPEAGGVPDYIRNSQEARQANADAAAGISTGVPPRIKISGKGAFKLVDGNGEEKVYPQGSMIIGPDQNAYMSTIILRARPALRKTWYVDKFNPSEEAGAPDCYSDDSVKPHPSIANPQCDSCEMCKLNAFGTGTDQDDNATAGKACRDTKILAVFVPNKGVHMLKVPPSSLKNFGLFVKQLSNSNIPLSMIMTYIGFDMDVDFPKLVFKFGGWLPAEAVPKVEKLKNSSEVTDIVGGSTGQALTAPKQDDSAAKKKAEAEAAAKKKAEAEAKKKAEAEAAAKKKAEAEATSQDTDDPFGFDLDLNTSTTEETQISSSDPSDEELRAQLGL